MDDDVMIQRWLGELVRTVSGRQQRQEMIEARIEHDEVGRLQCRLSILHQHDEEDELGSYRVVTSSSFDSCSLASASVERPLLLLPLPPPQLLLSYSPTSYTPHMYTVHDIQGKPRYWVHLA